MMVSSKHFGWQTMTGQGSVTSLHARVTIRLAGARTSSFDVECFVDSLTKNLANSGEPLSVLNTYISAGKVIYHQFKIATLYWCIVYTTQT